MTTAERIKAVITFGFTERQARFLVLALRHGGICVPRQYAGLAGIAAAGRRCHALFRRLVSHGHASAIDCNHNRARLYHVHSKALYSAIGEPTSPYRRAVSPRTAITRLMILDAVLATPDIDWLTPVETAAHFALRCSRARSTVAPQPASGEASEASSERRQMFPVGVDPTGCTVFLFLAAEPWTSGLRRFRGGHLRLIRSTPHWRIRLVFPRPLDGLTSQFVAAVREVLGHSAVNVEEQVKCVTLPHFYRHLSPLVSALPAAVE